jgi:hypothetical protein
MTIQKELRDGARGQEETEEQRRKVAKKIRHHL